MGDFLTANGRLHHFRYRQRNGPRAIAFSNSLGTDSRIWDEVVAGLPSDVSVLTYDKSGHGLSEDGATTIEEFASDLAALMDELNIRNATICGVSVGGMIAQALACSRPDLVADLVLCNTSHQIGTRESWNERIAKLENIGLEGMADGILENWFANAFRNRRPDLVLGYRMMLARTPVEGYRTVCSAIRDADLSHAIPSITCPTFCIAGDNDRATPPSVVEAMSALIPGAKYTCLKGVGHLPCIEAPEILIKVLRERLGAPHDL
ncbi:MAG: 3-oxoadipate enol-lactonase [Pseudomonadota bacterium]